MVRHSIGDHTVISKITDLTLKRILDMIKIIVGEYKKTRYFETVPYPGEI